MLSFYLPHAACAAARRAARGTLPRRMKPDFNNMHFIIKTKSEKVNADVQKGEGARMCSLFSASLCRRGVKSNLKSRRGKVQPAHGGFYQIGNFMRQFRHINGVCLHKLGQSVAVFVSDDGDDTHVAEAFFLSAHGGGTHSVRAHGDVPEVVRVSEAGVHGEQQGVTVRFADEVHPFRHVPARDGAVGGAVDKGGEALVQAEEGAHFGPEGVSGDGGSAEAYYDDVAFQCGHAAIIPPFSG